MTGAAKKTKAGAGVEGGLRRIYCGDNLPILRRTPDETADLVYLDPPFNSGRAHYPTFGGGTAPAFDDSWKWSAESGRLIAETAALSAPAGKMLSAFADAFGRGPLAAYLARMGAMLAELRRVTAPEACVYLHCDPSVSAHLRILMDAIFGAGGFRNEIAWAYGLGGGSARSFSRKHDSILFYAKGRRWRFSKPLVAATSRRMRGMQKGMTDVWTDIPSLNNMALERVGYPTQKPLALLERIIAASSAPGDVVLDPFCGSGTTLAAAEKLGRQWIGMDRSPTALKAAAERMRRMDPPLLPDPPAARNPGRGRSFNPGRGMNFAPRAAR